MSITKELRWKDLTEVEQNEAVSCGKLSNPEDFNYHRVLGELYAADEEHSWLVSISVD